MDSKELELYQEEQRQNLLDLNKAITDLSEVVKNGLAEASARPEVTKVEGEVQVNTEKAVEVSNLQDVVQSLQTLSIELTKAIESNSYKPEKSVEVTNIKDAVPEAIEVTNIGDIQAYFHEVAKAIIENKPIVNVAKQDIVFPTSAKDAIPVRLSDGKGFYTAMASAITTGHIETDPLVGYQPSDIDDNSTPKYYGFAKPGGRWYIMRESSGAYRYSRGAPNDAQGGGLYSDAWTNRANLTYGYIYEVF